MVRFGAGSMASTCMRLLIFTKRTRHLLNSHTGWAVTPLPAEEETGSELRAEQLPESSTSDSLPSVTGAAQSFSNYLG